MELNFTEKKARRDFAKLHLRPRALALLCLQTRASLLSPDLLCAVITHDMAWRAHNSRSPDMSDLITVLSISSSSFTVLLVVPPLSKA